jgi:hypothetical protein
LGFTRTHLHEKMGEIGSTKTLDLPFGALSASFQLKEANMRRTILP